MSKQFLLICDEIGLEVLKRAFREDCIQFLEVQGMNLNGENKINLLVTPVNPPVPPAQISIPAVDTPADSQEQQPEPS